MLDWKQIGSDSPYRCHSVNPNYAEGHDDVAHPIAGHGFEYIDMPPRERDPLVFDWDDQDARMLGATFARHWLQFSSSFSSCDATLTTPSPDQIGSSEYRVYSHDGLLLDRFSERSQAVAAFHRWKQAAFVICCGRVIASKE